MPTPFNLSKISNSDTTSISSNLNSTDSLQKKQGFINGSDLQILLSSLKDLEDTSLGNIYLSNFTEKFLKSSLWPSLQMHKWTEQAEKILHQPEYIVMLVLCLFALITNFVSIIAVCHVRHSLTNHLKLIINLAVSDILIALSVLIHIINKIFNSPQAISDSDQQDRMLNACAFAAVSAINIMSFLIALFTLLAMAADHYIAIMNPLRYPHLMSKKHGYILITVMWIGAAFGGFSNFMFGITSFKSQTLFNYCEFIMYDSYHAEFLIFGVTIICLFAITFIYSRIYLEVKRMNRRTPSIPRFTLHNKKAMITTLVIIATFTICWLPYCIFQLAMIVETHIHQKAVYQLFNTFLLVSKYLYVLQLTNSFLDPIIYAVRLNVVKTGYRNFLKRLRNRKNLFASLIQLKKGKRTNRLQRRSKFLTKELESDCIQDKTDATGGQMETSQLHLISNGFPKMSDESDMNDNELIPMVTLETVHNLENDLSDDLNIESGKNCTGTHL